MTEASVPGAEVASPCIGVCRVDGQGVCVGCGRTIDEIGGWLTASAGQKRAIVERAQRRCATRVEGPA